MKKKLLVVAVAGALAAPGIALAQSSVTIKGIFKTSLEAIRVGSKVAATNSSETRLADDSSRIIFNVKEDLGGGLAAIGQIDMRFNLESGALAASGNDHVGLTSKSLGTVIFGRQDLHYYNRESNLTNLAGSLRADSISLIAYAGGGGSAIAGTTRTPNVIRYVTPNFGGFTMLVGYSTSGSTGQADLTTAARKGSSWNLNPNFKGKNFQVGWSYWKSKRDAPAAGLATGDQKANRLYGSFNIAGFKLGLAWDKSTIADATGLGDLSERTAWSFPVSYNMGPHGFHGHYTKAGDDKRTPGVQDGAKMFAFSYQYSLSKRTSVGLTYAKITNDAGAAYNFFTASSLGNSAFAAVAGEDPRLFAATIRHAF